MNPELQHLIDEQARDERFGDRVHSISLDAALDDMGGRTLGDVIGGDGENWGRRPRRQLRTKRIKGSLSYRKKYRAGCRCQECRWENARACWDAWQRRKQRAGS